MRIPTRLRSGFKWLLPGLGVKRWLLVMAAGVALLGLAVGVVLWQLVPLSLSAPILFLGDLPTWARALALGVLGGGLVVAGLAGMNRNLLAPFTSLDGSVVEALYQLER